jgi:hypothetical protein
MRNRLREFWSDDTAQDIAEVVRIERMGSRSQQGKPLRPSVSTTCN